MSQPFQPPAVGPSQPSSTPKDRDALFSKIYHYPWAQDSDFQTGFSSIAGDTGRNASDSPVYHDTDLLLQAQCFYYTRKHNLPDPVDVAAYKSWISSKAHSQPTVEQASPDLHEPLSNPSYKTQTRTRTQDTAAEATLAQTDGTSSPNPNPNLNPNSNSDSSDPSSPPTTSSTSTSSSNPSQTSSNPTAEPAAPFPTNFSSIVDLITRDQPIPGIENIPDTVLDPALSRPDSTPRRRKPWEKEKEEEEEKKKEDDDDDGEAAGPDRKA